MKTINDIRSLWHKASSTATADEMDIFFEETYDRNNCHLSYDGEHLTAALQWGERKMTFVGRPVSVGVISLLIVDPALKGDAYDAALQNVLASAHRQQFAQGIMYSLIVPADDKLRKWLNAHGYMTATHQLTAETHHADALSADPKINVEEAEEWGRDLWIYYTQNAGHHDFELKLSESDFYAMIQLHDLREGKVLVARRHGKIVGLALARREGKTLKSGKPSSKQFRINIRYVIAADDRVLTAIQAKALELWPDCKQITMTAGCPAKGFKNAVPHAMLRVVSAVKFLSFVAETLPGLQLHVGIESDTDIPENNLTYRLRYGRCYTSSESCDSIVTPGGIPAMLLAGQMVQVPSI